MEPFTIGVTAIVALFLMLLLGFHVFISMALVGFAGFWAVTGNLPGAVGLTASTAFSVSSTYEFSVIPLFILLGMVIYESEMATPIYDVMYRWLGRLPAGLGIATIFSVAIFSAISGSSLASAVTFAKLAVPEMVKRGYKKSLACGIVAAAATQDSLIPPSALLVIYAIMTEQSIAKCLIAGTLPGIFSCLLYGVMAVILAKARPDWMPRGARFTMREKLESLKKAWQIPLLAVLILGIIYKGVCTPTEAAAVGTFLAMVFAIASVGLRKMRLPESLRATVSSTTMIFAIFIGAFIFGSFMAVSRIPVQLAELIKVSGVSKEFVLFIIIASYSLMGMFMGATAKMVVTLPIFFPIIISFGYDPIWFGVICVKMAGIGMITPPVGLVVYAVKGTVGDLATLEDIFKGSIIFLIVDYISLFFLILFPWISLVLPSMMTR